MWWRWEEEDEEGRGLMIGSWELFLKLPVFEFYRNMATVLLSHLHLLVRLLRPLQVAM